MQIQDFEIKNRRGKRVPMTIRIPDAVAKGTMVVLHGLGGWKDQSVIVVVAERVCENGYNVVTFDAADGTKAPDADFFHQTTTGYVRDVEDVVEFIKQAEWYTAPLVMAGHSVGGLVALTYTARHQEGIARLILMAPAISWKMMWYGQIPWTIPWLISGKRKWPAGPNRFTRLLSRDWIFDFFKFDGYASAREISIPILIIAAARDNTVAKPALLQRLAAKEFRGASYARIPGAGHVFWKHEIEVADTITKWLTLS